MEFLIPILFEPIATAIGWLCLWIWHRDIKKVKQVRDDEFDGSYVAVTKWILMNIIAAIGTVVLLVLGGAGLVMMAIYIIKSLT